MSTDILNKDTSSVPHKHTSILSRNLRYLRNAYDLTQEELMALLPSHPSVISISMWERGRTKPRHSHILELATLFNIDPKTLTTKLLKYH